MWRQSNSIELVPSLLVLQIPLAEGPVDAAAKAEGRCAPTPYSRRGFFHAGAKCRSVELVEVAVEEVREEDEVEEAVVVEEVEGFAAAAGPDGHEGLREGADADGPRKPMVSKDPSQGARSLEYIMVLSEVMRWHQELVPIAEISRRLHDAAARCQAAGARRRNRALVRCGVAFAMAASAMRARGLA